MLVAIFLALIAGASYAKDPSELVPVQKSLVAPEGGCDNFAAERTFHSNADAIHSLLSTMPGALWNAQHKDAPPPSQRKRLSERQSAEVAEMARTLFKKDSANWEIADQDVSAAQKEFDAYFGKGETDFARFLDKFIHFIGKSEWQSDPYRKDGERNIVVKAFFQRNIETFLLDFSRPFDERISHAFEILEAVGKLRTYWPYTELKVDSPRHLKGNVTGRSLVSFIIWNLSRLPPQNRDAYFGTLVRLFENDYLVVRNFDGKDQFVEQFVYVEKDLRQAVLSQGIAELAVRHDSSPGDTLLAILSGANTNPQIAEFAFSNYVLPNVILKGGKEFSPVLEVALAPLASSHHKLYGTADKFLRSIFDANKKLLDDPLVGKMEAKYPFFKKWLDDYRGI